MGVPGVGKSVLAKQVAEKLEFTAFSFNQYAMMMTMRRDINPISDKIRKFQSEGKPIDDPTKVEVVSNFFRCTMAKSKGLLFDAFPENLALMEKLKDIMPIKAVINLTTKEDILMEKFAGCAYFVKRAIVRSDTYVRQEGLTCNQYNSSSQRCSKGLRSGICAGHRGSSTQNSSNQVFMDPVLCTGAQSCLNRKGLSQTVLTKTEPYNCLKCLCNLWH